VLGQAEIPLAVARDLKVTPERLYRDEKIGLSLDGAAHV
jgi:propionate CoA-transferase